MMLRKAAALIAAPLLLTLTACSGGSPDDLKGADSESMTYRGETIHCTEVGAGKSRSMSCDFTKFYAKHPELLEDAGEGEEEDVTWLNEGGKPLACLQKGSGQTQAIACDWQRLYANYPAAFDK